MSNQKNLLLAIVASVMIMVSFQYFWERPKVEAERARQQEAATTTAQDRDQPQAPRTAPGQTPAPAAQPQQQPDTRLPSPPRATPGAPASQAMAPGGPVRPSAGLVIRGLRVTLGNPLLEGSVALKGGRIDDIVLKTYRQTTDPNSDPIRLLAPSGSADAYYAAHGWIGENKSVPLPGLDTLWKSSGRRLGPGAPLRLTWDNGQGLRFTRTIAVDENYMFTVTQRVDNRGAKAVTLTPYGLINRTGTPETTGFYILHEGPLGVFNEVLEELDYSDLVDEGQIDKASRGGWIGITDKYWLAALVPDQKAKMTARFRHWTSKDKSDKYQVEFVGVPLTIAPGGNATAKSHVFAGAKKLNLLNQYSEKLGIALFDRAIDFGWLYFLTKPFFYVLDFFFKFLGNFGLAILAVTVIVKILFFPLANKSYRSMSEMKKLQPKVMEMKERFGDDKQKLSAETMALYKREKVNPAASCLPIIIQIPVFFALYKVLFISIEMRHAPFYGWIQDLSARDPTSIINLFGLLPFGVPAMIPDFISIGIWPLIMGVSMFLQMKLNPTPPDPVQAKIFMLMPIFFTFIMAPFPAGLVIYWAWNNALSMTQQYIIMKRMGVAPGQRAPGKT
ncbi:MAG: membrane protein insertase YidC [Alphaproteobacteria bacterium]|nr:membrane protein insertase YidC [Alphaproteobacteria bacterium]